MTGFTLDDDPPEGEPRAGVLRGLVIPHPLPYLPSLHWFMLTSFIATTKALTAVRGRSCQWILHRLFAPFDPDANRRRQGFIFQNPQLDRSIHSRPGHKQLSLLIASDLPTFPPPTTASPFHHDRFDTLLHRHGLPRLSPGQTQRSGDHRRAVKGSLIPSWLPDRLGRIEFTCVTDWSFTFRLLSTSPHGNAVTVSYRLVTFAWKGLPPS